MNNGQRFETYVIAGQRGSGMICLNGAAARCVSVGDKVIIMCYALMTPEEADANPPRVVFVDDDNRPRAHHPLRAPTADWRTWTASAPERKRIEAGMRRAAAHPGLLLY